MGSGGQIRAGPISEAISVFLEHLVTQKDNMPKQQWESWERYIRGTYRDSPVLRDFFKERSDWFSEKLLSILRETDSTSRSV